MRILFTGGGTGGHIFSIIAVKREITIEGAEFLFIGSQIVEEEILKKEGLKSKKILAGKWRRYFSFKNFIDILKIPIGFFQANFLVWSFMPDIIFSKGGPGSILVGLIGWLYRIPIIIHESDSIPSLSTRILAPFAKKIAISFKETEKYLPKNKIVFTGHPVRRKLLEGSSLQAKKIFNLSGERKIILFIGGTQGAEELNELLLYAIYKYLEKYEIIHICGRKNYKKIDLETKGVLREHQRKYYHLYPYLDEEELSHAYKVSDFIVSRAGAGVIFEIALFQKPSIIIPLAGAAQEHQIKNAYLFQENGASIVIEKPNLTYNFLFERIRHTIEDEKKMNQMREACKKFSKPEAAKIIAKILLENA